MTILADPLTEEFFNNHVSSFYITALPADVIEYCPSDAYHFNVEIVRREQGRWAVMHRGFCYDAELNEEYESIPSSRTNKFKKKYRHPLKDAIRIAFRIAPTIKLMRWDVEGYTTRQRAEMAQEKE